MKFILGTLTILLLSISLTSCRKGEGVGGKAEIKGKVYVKYYNSTGTAVLKEYYGADVDVFIIYGDNDFYDDKVATHYDGSFKFEYLRPGNYTIFVYSKDVTGAGDNPDIPIIVETEITGKKDVIELVDIVIEDN